MRKLQTNALRARTVLERESQPLTKECCAIIERDLKRVLDEYFIGVEEVRLKTARDRKIEIVLEAKAENVLPFGTIRG